MGMVSRAWSKNHDYLPRLRYLTELVDFFLQYSTGCANCKPNLSNLSVTFLLFILVADSWIGSENIAAAK